MKDGKKAMKDSRCHKQTMRHLVLPPGGHFPASIHGGLSSNSTRGGGRLGGRGMRGKGSTFRRRPAVVFARPKAGGLDLGKTLAWPQEGAFSRSARAFLEILEPSGSSFRTGETIPHYHAYC
jgi:hypothetical protein